MWPDGFRIQEAAVETAGRRTFFLPPIPSFSDVLVIGNIGLWSRLGASLPPPDRRFFLSRIYNGLGLGFGKNGLFLSYSL